MPIFIDARGQGFQAIKGVTLPGGFIVKSCIEKGSYGQIFDCYDGNSGRHLVVKFSDEYKILADEIVCMR